ncbi:hypothetical protein [Burkholderia vietnamiensis]|uniref:hypothetical protein n=1 Tax=Burkholderia vietnamiensis TaxID=60552 RepID=UPI001B98DAAC|nr:hypothetical protein [Burkholderia vietnamiensis]MBR8219702.1 hypothetical protein [Burkholderia vietnamiensis]
MRNIWGQLRPLAPGQGESLIAVAILTFVQLLYSINGRSTIDDGHARIETCLSDDMRHQSQNIKPKLKNLRRVTLSGSGRNRGHDAFSSKDGSVRPSSFLHSLIQHKK